jgi:hypothetical protein
MGIPPDAYPVGQDGRVYAGTTKFDAQMGGSHVRSAEIRGNTGEDVVSISVSVIPPKNKPSVPLASIGFGIVNGSEPQITVTIQTPDGSAIADGYDCQFTFVSLERLPGK